RRFGGERPRSPVFAASYRGPRRSCGTNHSDRRLDDHFDPTHGCVSPSAKILPAPAADRLGLLCLLLTKPYGMSWRQSPSASAHGRCRGSLSWVGRRRSARVHFDIVAPATKQTC